MIVRNPSHTTSEPVENKADRTMHLLLSSCKIPLSLQIRESGKNLMSGEKCLFSISSSSLYSCNRLAQNVHKSSSRQKEKGKNVQWSQRSKSTKAVAGKKKRKRKTHGHPITCCDCRRKQKTEKEQAEHGERHRARKNFHGRRVRQHLFPCTLAPGIEIVPRATPKVLFFNLRSPLRSEIPFSSSPPNDRSIYLLLLHSWSTDISDNHF